MSMPMPVFPNIPDGRMVDQISTGIPIRGMSNEEFQRQIRLGQYEADLLANTKPDEIPESACPICAEPLNGAPSLCPGCARPLDVVNGVLVAMVPPEPVCNRKGHRL